ncbi:hypothetical protein H1235_01925 [Pseudoxanthomonas sp. NC8]|nr:hypothetical protein H1235_01925 [Pseudoxanthomonas sp. NC8]
MSGSGTAIAILQNVMVQVMFREAPLEQMLQAAPQGVPPAMALWPAMRACCSSAFLWSRCSPGQFHRPAAPAQLGALVLHRGDGGGHGLGSWSGCRSRSACSRGCARSSP